MKLCAFECDKRIKCPANMKRLSMIRRCEAQEAITSLALNKSVKNIWRSLQSTSISHCLARRLRKAIDCFKLLLSSVSVDTARKWYTKRLLSVIFGKWMAFVNGEQHRDKKLCEKGASIHTAVSLRRYQRRLFRHGVTRRHLMDNMQFAFAFCAYIRLLTSFEKFSHMRSIKRSARNLVDSADSYVNKRNQAKYLSKFSHLIYRIYLNFIAD